MDPAISSSKPQVIVVMGVAASGKTTVGAALAQALGWPFHDADDLHPAANKAKMHSGIPLTDEDRAPWLASVSSLIDEVIRGGGHAVVACSALKAVYRAALISRDVPGGAVRFAFLDVPRAELEKRLAGRKHFFPASLLDSQLDALEKPQDAVWVDGTRPVPEIVSALEDSFGL
jgi:gluconokinase